MKEIQSRYLLTLGPPVPCRLFDVTTEEIRKEGFPPCDYDPEIPHEDVCLLCNAKKGGCLARLGYYPAWNQMYPKHPYSPDRWTWGYPMEVRRR